MNTLNFTSTGTPGSQHNRSSVNNNSNNDWRTMEALRIKGSTKTPEVSLDPAAGEYNITGRSLPEDAVGFYSKIKDWLERFVQVHNFQNTVTFRMELEYFNTSSSKCLLDVFKEIDKMHKDGKDVAILWCYDEDDEDMEETGEDYRDLLSVPFELEAIEY